MKKTIALLLTMVLMLCSLGTAVLADDTAAPVITDAYIGGFPVVNEYLHAVVDGTYDGTAFEDTYDSTSETYVVTAEYVWEYGEGETWTTIADNGNNADRICKVTSAMVGQYVRCKITPKAAGVEGETFIATFPTKIAASATWMETVQLEEDFSEGMGVMTPNSSLTSVVEDGVLKLSGWENLSTWNATENTLPARTLFISNTQKANWKAERKMSFSFDGWTDKGSLTNLTIYNENWSALVFYTSYRGGEWKNSETISTEPTTFSVLYGVTEILNGSYASKKPANAGGIVTSAMSDRSVGRSNALSINADYAAEFSDGISALYLDNYKIIEKTIPYTVTVTDGTETVKTETVGTGDSLTVDLSVPGKKAVSAKVNGADAEIIDNSVSLERIYQDYEIAVTYEDVAIDRLSLEANPVYYKGTDREESPVLLTAYEADGTKYDVTGMKGVTYASSDESVFSVNGNQVKSNGKVGLANITATYGDKTAGITMMRTAGTETEKTESSMASHFKADSSVMKGRDGGQAYFVDGVDAYNTSYSKYGASLAARVQTGRGNWLKNHLYTVTGWFYDDAEKTTSPGLSPRIYTNLAKETAAGTDLSAIMSYGEFDWTLTNDTDGLSIMPKITAKGDTYALNDSSVNIARSKGWHQGVVTLHQDPTAEDGWSLSCYLDGVFIGKFAVLLTTSTDSDFELRHTAPAQNSGLVYYYDDFLLSGSIMPEYAGVHYTIGENGSVSVDGTAKANGKWDYVTVGTDVALELVPDNGYQAKVTVDGNPVTVSSNNQLTVENITEDTEIAVTFEKVDTTPVISVNSTVMDGGTQTVDGVNYPSYLVYSSITNYGTVTGYGMKLSDGTNTKDLPAGATTEKTALELLAASQGKFAFRVFGKAIDENECTLTPYYEIDGEKQYSSASNSFGGTTKE